jgi:hypothetical protein
MALTDFKVNVLQAINEVRKKQKLSSVTTIDQDSDSLAKLDYLNDVIADLSDYGNWQEQYREYIVSVQASVRDYAVSGVVIQNINEVALSTRTGELVKRELEDIRRLQRNNSTGEPTQWALKGINGEGNPIITFDRWPSASDQSKFFRIAAYEKPAVYTTADATTTIPFPGRVVVQGLLAMSILDESDGEPTSRYAANLEMFENMKKESFNRFNGDTGASVYFRPGRGRR